MIFDVENAKCNAVLGSSAWKVRKLCRIWGFSVESAKCRRNLGFSAWKIRNAVRDFRFSVQKGRKSDQVCNLEFSRSKIALPCVPTRCAISGIRRRGGYIYVSANFRHSNQLIRTLLSIASGLLKSDAAEPSVLWATIYYLRNQVLGPACGR